MADTVSETKHIVPAERLGVNFTVYVQDDGESKMPRCTVLVLHDLGVDHKSYRPWIGSIEMDGVRERCTFLHVDFPGQEDDAVDLPSDKYPSLDDLARELVNVVNLFNYTQVVVIGEGAGANVALRFAISYPERVLGLCLMHPTASSASLWETVKDKFANWRLMKQGMNPQTEAFLLWHRYGDKIQASINPDMESRLKEFHDTLYRKRNPKNLALFIQAFQNRTNITDRLELLNCDVMVVVGKRSPYISNCAHFYEILNDVRRKRSCTMENSPLLEVEGAGDVLDEAPGKVSLSFQFFLQGIGLVAAIPMHPELVGQGRRASRTYSMEEMDKPGRRNSLLGCNRKDSISESPLSESPID